MTVVDILNVEDLYCSRWPRGETVSGELKVKQGDGAEEA